MEKIGLALIGKIIQEYDKNSDGQFVVFRRIPMTYTSQNFIFKEDEKRGIDALEAKHNQADFSAICNSIPSVSRFWDDKPFNLVQELNAILDSAIFPRSSLSTEDQKRLNEAKAYISESGAYETYKSFREKYFDTLEKINEYKLKSIETVKDEEKQILADQIRLETKKLKEIEADWVYLGKKNEIEAKRALITALETKGIAVDWQQAKVNMADDGGIVQFDPITMQKIYPTFFSPKDFYKEDITSGWSKITLKENDVNQFQQYAIDNLFSGDKHFLQEIDDGLEIKEIKAEIARVTVERPWFARELFFRRDWKLPNEYVISTGGNNPEGRIPAYIQSLLFVRNVEIDIVSTKKNRAIISKCIQNNMPLQIGPLLVQTPQKVTSDKISKLRMSSKFNTKISNHFREAIQFKNLSSINTKGAQNLLLKKGISNKVLMANKLTPETRKVIAPPIFIPKLPPSLISSILLSTSKKFGYKGVVKDDSGIPVQVSLTFTNEHNPNIQKTSRSDNKGFYNAVIVKGTYKLEINESGYDVFRKILPYKEGDEIEIKELNIVLKKSDIEVKEDELNELHSGYLLFGYICNLMPKSPNPDEDLDWPEQKEVDLKDIVDDIKENPYSYLKSFLNALNRNT